MCENKIEEKWADETTFSVCIKSCCCQTVCYLEQSLNKTTDSVQKRCFVLNTDPQQTLNSVSDGLGHTSRTVMIINSCYLRSTNTCLLSVYFFKIYI